MPRHAVVRLAPSRAGTSADQPGHHPGDLPTDLPDRLPDTVDDALVLVPAWASEGWRPGEGRTLALWELLATLAARDLAVARAVEPHLDAAAILDQAGTPRDTLPGGAARADASWGVFAAEGPGVRVVATPTPDGEHAVRLDGTKPWCSLGHRLDAALVTAWLDGDRRGLFAVDLHHPGVSPDGTQWAARGLTEIRSTGLRFEGVPATAVGEAGWYLRRPGFWWGGLGVAACWYGGTVGVARALWRRAAETAARGDGTSLDDALLAAALGAVDRRLHAARAVLAEAAAAVDAGAADTAGPILALRVRGTVAQVCEDVISAVGHALGPAPLATDAEHAKRVADLQLYVRQHHAERDDAALGRKLVAEAATDAEAVAEAQTAPEAAPW